MALTPANCGAVILAGGRSSRMGRCKALLELDGETLISRLAGELSAFDELLISSNDETLAAGLPGRVVRDVFPGCGPLAGLHAALSATEKEYLLCIPCDYPCFTAEGAAALLSAFVPGRDAMVCRDTEGRIHPLCGIYARTAAQTMERRLRAGRFRMMELLSELRTDQVSGLLPDGQLINVNTPEAFRHLAERRKEGFS